MKHLGMRKATTVTAAALLTAWGIQVVSMAAASAAPVTFSATGAPQSYTVPAGVIEVQVDALGA